MLTIIYFISPFADASTLWQDRSIITRLKIWDYPERVVPLQHFYNYYSLLKQAADCESMDNVTGLFYFPKIVNFSSRSE